MKTNRMVMVALSGLWALALLASPARADLIPSEQGDCKKEGARCRREDDETGICVPTKYKGGRYNEPVYWYDGFLCKPQPFPWAIAGGALGVAAVTGVVLLVLHRRGRKART